MPCYDIRYVTDRTIKAAYDSTGLTREEIYAKLSVGDLLVTKYKHGSMSIFMFESGVLNIIGYAGSRRDYAECYARAKETAMGGPVMAVVFPKMLGGVSEAGMTNVLAGMPNDKVLVSDTKL